MRNRIDDELAHIRKEVLTVALLTMAHFPWLYLLCGSTCHGSTYCGSTNQVRTVAFALPAQSAYEATLKRRQLSGWSPPHSQVKSDAVWDELLAATACAKERQAALRAIVDKVRAEEEWTKVVVFAPAGSAFDSAAAALRALPRPVLIGDPTDPTSTDRIDKFSRPDIRDPDAPLVLLMSFDHSSALNLQHVSHHIVFYAPLWGDDEGGVHAAANEQQAIGRVMRIGQVRDVVVHRLVAVGPKNQPTIEQLVVDRNTSDRVTRQAVVA